MPVPYYGAYQCPMCCEALWFAKGLWPRAVWIHSFPDDKLIEAWGDRQVCPNNAGIFMTQYPGAALERLEPIV